MSIKLVSWNVNGIRAVSKKDEFWDWFDNTDADIINFQEVRASQDKIPKKLADVDGFSSYFNEAEKKGYSGVGTYSKIKPLSVTKGLGVEELDNEGRVLKIEYENFILFNIYFPNSGKEGSRLDFKVKFCNELLKQLIELKNEGKNLVITGDYNIAHKPIDINNWKRQVGVSGFLPEEREWLDRWEASGMVDTFRMFDQSGEKYSWWSFRAGSRARNVGWRIDYHWVSEPLKERVSDAKILNEVVHSDHCPVSLEVKG